MSETRHYEMLWNCAYCGQQGLLGVSHRFCPACGAPQDPASRYFPDEAHKVAVEDHRYVGVDRICGNCSTPSSAAASHCPACGAALDEQDARVERLAGGADVAPGVARPAAPPPVPVAPSRRSRLGLWLALAVLLIVALLVALLWTRPVSFTVTGHQWQRSIDIEVLRDVREGRWCDATPADARAVSRERRQRGTRQVADGQDCRTVNIDQGDGSFRQEQRCETRYRSEPVFDAWCEYTVSRWVTQSTARAAGEGLSPAPGWPVLRTDDCLRIGCTRPGARSERYRVLLRTQTDGGAETVECDLPQARWQGMPAGSRWQAEQGVLTGRVDCDGLQPGG